MHEIGFRVQSLSIVNDATSASLLQGVQQSLFTFTQHHVGSSLEQSELQHFLLHQHRYLHLADRSNKLNKATSTKVNASSPIMKLKIASQLMVI